MAFPFGRRRKHVPVTWQQRAAAVVLTILTVIQTPLFSYKITYSDDSVRTRTWSLPEIVAVGLLRTNAESYAWYARAALMPGIFTRTALLQLDACVIQPSDACNWSALKDFDAMWALADYSDQVREGGQTRGVPRGVAGAEGSVQRAVSGRSWTVLGLAGCVKPLVFHACGHRLRACEDLGMGRVRYMVK